MISLPVSHFYLIVDVVFLLVASARTNISIYANSSVDFQLFLPIDKVIDVLQYLVVIV